MANTKNRPPPPPAKPAYQSPPVRDVHGNTLRGYGRTQREANYNRPIPAVAPRGGRRGR